MAAQRSPRVEFIAVTGDDGLLEQIGQALDGESTVRHAETRDAAREFVKPLRPAVLLLDSRGHDDLAATIGQLQSPDGTCVVVVLAAADQRADVARSVKGSATFAVLPIPVEPMQTAAVLEGAREEALARLALAAPQVTPSAANRIPATARDSAETPAIAPARSRSVATSAAVQLQRRIQSRSTAAGSMGSAGGGKSRVLPIGIAIAAAVAAAVAWFALHDSPRSPTKTALQPRVATHPQPVSVVPAPAKAEAVQDGSTDELLDKARNAFRERRYTDPEGDNALVYYRSVLAQDPGNGEAREGLERIGAVLEGRLQSLLADRRADEAARALLELKAIRPDDAGLSQWDARVTEAQIAGALDNGNVERANQVLRQASQAGTLNTQAANHWREEIARRQGEARAQQLAQLVSARIREGKLVDPANDSAKAYLAQLRKLTADPKGLGDAAAAELQQACLQKMRDATVQQQRADADRWANEARALGVTQAKIAAVQRDAAAQAQSRQSAAESARLAQLVQARIADGRLLEPAQDNALFYLNALRGADPTGTVWMTNARSLSDKLIERGRAALADRKLDAAQASAAAARQLGLSPGDVDALDRGIATARTADKSMPRQVAASEFKRTRYVQPEYPKEALQKGLKGEVRVRLTVDTDGKVKDVVIVNSTPAGIFDEAAQDAVRHWRFKPIVVDGTAIEASATTTLIFQPEDAKKP